jgi:hypothetical protein
MTPMTLPTQPQTNRAIAESLFGPKPKRCPAKFDHCGKCNIYPCLIGAPAINIHIEPATDENLEPTPNESGR